MNAAACANKKCTELIDFKTNVKFPLKCKTCDETITEKHYEAYKDMMSVTRTHLDKMKVSSVACMNTF